MRQWTVADVMTRDVVAVPPQATYRQIVDLVVDRAVSAVPVVDELGRVLGVVSEADLLHELERAAARRSPRAGWQARLSAAKADGGTAAELMTAPAVTVGPADRITDAARRLEARRVKRMPVVDVQGRLLGIVSRRDLLRLHTRPDADIRVDIVDNVLRRDLCVDPLSVEVDVIDGVVTETGKLESRSVARLAVALTREVAGVVDVVDRLTWEHDDLRRPRTHGYAYDDRVPTRSSLRPDVPDR
ncbi:CBS domain-containing protein [Asanoa sp. NPDC049518]|uniref:CBS domain-containing protein n=1 Tax=unclassified Asanoa TaxID=2685164 RepID=UPI003427A4BD